MPEERATTARPLQDRAALVTGGNRGLGRAFAVRLANLGANVAICDIDLKNHLEFELDRSQSNSMPAVDELLGLGIDAFAVEQDASDFDAQRQLAEAMVQRWGRIDLVWSDGVLHRRIHDGAADLAGRRAR